MREDGPVSFGISRGGCSAVVDEKGIAALAVTEVSFQSVHVLMERQMVGGIGVAGCVGATLKTCSFYRFLAFTQPVGRADRFFRLVGAGGGQPSGKGGL